MVSRAKRRQYAPAVILLFLLGLSLFLVACERPLDDAGEGDVEVTATPEADPDQGGGIEAEATQPVETPPEETETEEPAAEEEEESAIPSDAVDEADEEAAEETAEETEEATEEAEETTDETEEAAEETEEAASEETEEAAEETEEAADAEMTESEAAETETEEAAAETEEAATSDGGEQIHIVQPGENLYRIGLQYGISWVVLANYNNLPSADRIYVGQELRIPGDDDPDPGAPPPETPATYVIQPGDTLYRIGQAFGVDWREIAEANNIVNPYLIYAGQTLTIPGGEAPPETPPAEITHTVSAGETLFLISLQYGIPWTTIAEANEIQPPYVIYPGNQLTIPASN